MSSTIAVEQATVAQAVSAIAGRKRNFPLIPCVFVLLNIHVVLCLAPSWISDDELNAFEEMDLQRQTTTHVKLTTFREHHDALLGKCVHLTHLDLRGAYMNFDIPFVV